MPGDEKIVYVGFGTTTKIDPWQSLPGFMVEFLSSSAPPARCINIDPKFTSQSMNVALEHIHKYLPGTSSDEYAKEFLFVHDYFEEPEYEQLFIYCENILLKGGVLFLANTAGPTEVPYAAVLYNRLCKQFPRQITYLTYSKAYSQAQEMSMREGNFTVWLAGTRYTYYDETVATIRFEARNEFLCENNDITTQKAIDWYKKNYLITLQEMRLWQSWCNGWKPQELHDSLCDLTKDQLLLQVKKDFFEKTIAVEIMPAKALQTARVVLRETETRWIIEDIYAPGIAPFSLFDFTSPYARGLKARCAMDALARDLSLLQALK